MANLKLNTANFLNEVKLNLDNQTWDYQYCGSVNHKDAEKACNYLSTQRFSIKLIKERLEDSYSDILAELREQQIIGEGKAKFAAAWISSTLGEQRILKYNWSDSLVSSVTFSIN